MHPQVKSQEVSLMRSTRQYQPDSGQIMGDKKASCRYCNWLLYARQTLKRVVDFLCCGGGCVRHNVFQLSSTM